ncbi:DUF4232 domain-containing protein [Streptomyces sp. NBC_01102]|uniref:DUF4232 domain-containing protein n=1 Tax=Streptomyces sp. NBC_01102 TaxID=2903749 RepID=UPI00386520F3|nr:DUF4232 domain-containing protein [Streptomyces sp. NBC_01102]
MDSLSRTTPSPSERTLRPRSRRRRRGTWTIRRHLLVPVAMASLALTAAGCGDSSDAAGPAGATRSVPGSTAPGTASPSGVPSSAPAIAPGEPAGSEPAATGQASRRCTADGLSMSLGRGDAGAGQIHYRLTFENTSEEPCTLHGFPGVSLIKRDGSVIGDPAGREGGTREQALIAPGGTADVSLHTLNQGTDGPGCWDRPDYLRVYPPGSTEALTLRTPQLHVCGDRFTTTAVDG